MLLNKLAKVAEVLMQTEFSSRLGVGYKHMMLHHMVSRSLPHRSSCDAEVSILCYPALIYETG